MEQEWLASPLKLREYLYTLQDENYREFNAKLVKSDTDIILGIQIPKLRMIAKRLAKFDCHQILTFPTITFEEKAIKGFIIGYHNYTIQETIAYLRNFVQEVNNWAICDTTASSLMIFKKEQTAGFQFIKECLNSEQEFIIRYGLILLLAHYMNEQYIEPILEICTSIKSDYYYVNMALAWLISVAFVYHPEQTYPLFHGKLGKFVHNKSISKIRESYRVKQIDKDHLQTLRRK